MQASGLKIPALVKEKDVTDLSKINIEKELSQTQGLLEFIVISVAKSMNLTAPQVHDLPL